MRASPRFFKASSAVLKVAAWIFLLFGIVGSAAIVFDLVAMEPKWFAAVILVLYAFFFCFFYFVAKMADALGKILSEYKNK